MTVIRWSPFWGVGFADFAAFAVFDLWVLFAAFVFPACADLDAAVVFDGARLFDDGVRLFDVAWLRADLPAPRADDRADAEVLRLRELVGVVTDLTSTHD
ncbi:hypothetical protein [Streptomyces sp. RTd22]|uniref:hypothetical protein n=1 Tax=Streptomyces sp. RTd22 TaxID=1841249 RepID=UPI0007C49680|nr:hypothetical protein [Streptomyces sp. RTd22]